MYASFNSATHTHMHTHTHIHTRSLHIRTSLCAGMRIASYFSGRKMVKQGLKEYLRMADDPNHKCCAEASLVAGRTLISAGPHTDLKKGIKYLKLASRKGHKTADQLLKQIHGNTQDGKYLGPVRPVDGEAVPYRDLAEMIASAVEPKAGKNGGGSDAQTACVQGAGPEMDFVESVFSSALETRDLQRDECPESESPLGLEDSMDVMEEYVEKHPESVTGRAVMEALRHCYYVYAMLNDKTKVFETWTVREKDDAVANLYWAYALDVACVYVKTRDPLTGNIKIIDQIRPVYDHMQEVYADEKNEIHFMAVYVKFFMDWQVCNDDEQVLAVLLKAISIAQKPDAFFEVRNMLPNLYWHLGTSMLHIDNMSGALQAFEDALAALQQNDSASLWPYPSEEIPWQTARQQHILLLDAMLDRRPS
jgi:hypothetical protein